MDRMGHVLTQDTDIHLVSLSFGCVATMISVNVSMALDQGQKGKLAAE